MGRGQPAYDLEQLQRLIGQGPMSFAITRTAEEGAAKLNWDRSDIVEAVLELTAQHFYKSMESERMPGLWQDVYHLECRGIWLYIKLQLGTHGRAIVVQFKQR
ncbi:MAG TPA: type II toxin-antitoxin system MqsR family toxin [Longimicrobium sp.]|nr:type II toxin-antitoxin system MqsR family toxin [Longimicrobium sp.]